MLRSNLNLGSWLWAHITVFSGLFLGLRTDPESTKGGTIDVEGADSHCLIVSTVSFGLSYRYYKDIHFRILVCQCSVADSDSELLSLSLQCTVPAKIDFLSLLQRRPKGSKGGKQPSKPTHATSTHLSILSRLTIGSAHRKRQSKIPTLRPHRYSVSESFP
jgi:hypothetical protein